MDVSSSSLTISKHNIRALTVQSSSSLTSFKLPVCLGSIGRSILAAETSAREIGTQTILCSSEIHQLLPQMLQAESRDAVFFSLGYSNSFPTFRHVPWHSKPHDIIGNIDWSQHCRKTQKQRIYIFRRFWVNYTSMLCVLSCTSWLGLVHGPVL